MTKQLTLTESDIKEAIAFWLMNSVGTVGTVGTKMKSGYLAYDPGDMPYSGPTIYAKVEIE